MYVRVKINYQPCENSRFKWFADADILTLPCSIFGAKRTVWIARHMFCIVRADIWHPHHVAFSWAGYESCRDSIDFQRSCPQPARTFGICLFIPRHYSPFTTLAGKVFTNITIYIITHSLLYIAATTRRSRGAIFILIPYCFSNDTF